MLPLDAPTVQLSDASFKRLAGKGSVYFNAVKAKFPCFFYLLYNSHSLRFYGTEDEIQKIKVFLSFSLFHFIAFINQ